MVVVWLAICLTAPPGLAQDDRVRDEFKEMTFATGAKYTNMRRRFLAEPDSELLQGKLQSAEPLQELQAIILVGWLENSTYFESLLRRPPILDRARQPHYYWWRNEDLREEAIPLLQELILKGGSHANSQLDASVALTLMHQRGTRMRTNWILPLLSSPEITNSATRQSAALLFKSAQPKDVDLNSLLDVIGDEDDGAVAVALLSGFASVARDLPDDEKDEVVETLIERRGLTERLGQTDLIRAIGEIGGPRAVEFIRESQKDIKEDVIEVGELIDILRQMSDPNATRTILDIANDDETNIDLRIQAISALSDCPYGLDAVQALSAIAQRKSRTLKERSEAISCLDRIHRRRTEEGGDGNDVKERILELQKTIEEETLKPMLNRVVRRVLVRGAP